MEKMLECSEVLSPNCMESHLDQATSLIFNMPVNLEKWSSVMQNCQAQSEPRYKRSAGKSKGNRGSSISRAISRISTARNLSKGRLPSSSSSHGKSGILSKS